MKKQVMGQIDLFDYIAHQDEVSALGGCLSCICHKCLHRYGGCPYEKCYLDEWCKGGIF